MAFIENSDDSKKLMSLGLELCRVGKVDEGIECYRKAFEAFNKMPASSITPEVREMFLTQYSSLLFAKQRYEEVVYLFKSELAKLHDGLNASHHYLLGFSLYKLKKINEAISELNNCVAKSKNKPSNTGLPDLYSGEPHYLLAVCYAVLNKGKEADKEFNRALDANPESFKFNYDYARFLAGQGNFEKAITILKKILPQTSANPAVWQLGARIALNNEKLVGYALQWTEEALKYCPEDPELIEYRGDALLLNGFIEQARECFSRLPVSARQKACIIFCEVVSGESSSRIEKTEEPVVSHEIIRLYRRCLNSKANNLISCFNRNIHVLESVLPSAHKVLTFSLRQFETNEEE
jgi:tetratricopeptide (TPR) repeat protein